MPSGGGTMSEYEDGPDYMDELAQQHHEEIQLRARVKAGNVPIPNEAFEAKLASNIPVSKARSAIVALVPEGWTLERMRVLDARLTDLFFAAYTAGQRAAWEEAIERVEGQIRYSEKYRLGNIENLRGGWSGIQ